jgi:hypothetical protein
MREANSFNPQDHVITLTRRYKDSSGKVVERRTRYLPVRARLQWFRDQFPIESGWCIRTEIVSLNQEEAVVKASIIDPDGREVSTGLKRETKQSWPDFLEKAETGAIGRALAAAGFGTAFAVEFEEGERVVDAPVDVEQEALEDIGVPEISEERRSIGEVLNEVMREARTKGIRPKVLNDMAQAHFGKGFGGQLTAEEALRLLEMIREMEGG